MNFLDPTNDFAFVRIFGNKKDPAILISFLNSILHLRDDKAIEHITILNPYQASRIKGGKNTILDIRCQDGEGAKYIVEMQVLKGEFFDKQILFHAFTAYIDQLGDSLQHRELIPVISLSISNFNFSENKHYISTHIIHNEKTKEQIWTDLQFKFVELPKFNKTEDELKTTEDKWLYFLKHAKELNAVPGNIKEPAIREAFEIANQANWNGNL